MINRLLSITFLLLLVLLACTDPPDYPKEPVIEFLGMDRNTMTQGPLQNEKVYMTISFTDGDGDLGNDDKSDTTKVYITDYRRTPPDVTPISIPMVPELGTGNGISGELSFRIFNSCCIEPGAPFISCEKSETYPVDTVVYDIYIVDRAGNKSNVIQSEPLYLLCE